MSDSANAKRHAPPRRVLLVDDAADIRQLYTALLASAPGRFETAEAGSSLQALGMLSARNFDCIVLDYSLPGQDGLQLLRHLRDAHGRMPCPVIMITAQGSEDVAVQAMKLGARDYLVKNRIDRETLIAAIDYAIEQSESEAARVRYNESLERAAVTDPLTGLYNRRHLIDALEVELARVERYRAPLSVLMMDVDHFKRVNDRYGHLAGDAVLTGFATLLQRVVRATDIVARLGGEEFCAVLCETPLDGARRLASRILAEARALAHADGRGSEFTVTLSIGIAEAQHGMTEADMLIGGADEALYAAKTAGRDCYRIHGQSEEAPARSREATDTAFRV